MPPSDAELWTRMNAQPRHAAAELKRKDVPEQRGVYAWYRDGEPVYAGQAAGAQGLRDRVWKYHLGRSRDLSRSSFRRNVCEHLAIAPTIVTKARPATLSHEDVAPVNTWIRECEVAWIECDSAEDADELEKALFAEWMPPLSRK